MLIRNADSLLLTVNILHDRFYEVENTVNGNKRLGNTDHF